MRYLNVGGAYFGLRLSTLSPGDCVVALFMVVGLMSLVGVTWLLPDHDNLLNLFPARAVDAGLSE